MPAAPRAAVVSRSLDASPGPAPPPASQDPLAEVGATAPATPQTRAAIQAARRKASRRRRRWARRAGYVALALVVVCGLLVVGGYVYAGYRFDQIKKVRVANLVKAPPPGKPFNVLLVGSDTRAFETPGNQVQANAFGTGGTDGGQRSDVTIVARFVPATRQVYLLSIPRDLWVHIPGDGPEAGMNRINAAFNNGPSLLIKTIEDDLQIPIHHYVYINFNGFQNMVNALGGVTMDFPDPLRDQYSGLDVTSTGCQMVNGSTALELVRARHVYYYADGYWQYDGLSDFSRIRRQDAFFRALMDKFGGDLTNVFAINDFFGAAVHNMVIDRTIDKSDVIRWAEEFHGISGADLHTFTLPTTSFTTDGGAAVLQEAQPYADNLVFTFNLVGTPSLLPKHGRATTTTTTSGSGSLGTGGSAGSLSTLSLSTGATGGTTSPSTASPDTTSTSSTTTTTIPSDVYTNTQPEPWNPSPCSM